MMHKKEQSWIEREQNAAPLTVTGLVAACDAITHALAASPHANSVKHHLLNDMAAAMGSSFDRDAQGNPTLQHQHTHSEKPPATLAEMKKRLTHLRNKLSNEPVMQDLCESATNAAVAAVTQTMAHEKNGKH